MIGAFFPSRLTAEAAGCGGKNNEDDEYFVGLILGDNHGLCVQFAFHCQTGIL